MLEWAVHQTETAFCAAEDTNPRGQSQWTITQPLLMPLNHTELSRLLSPEFSWWTPMIKDLTLQLSHAQQRRHWTDGCNNVPLVLISTLSWIRYSPPPTTIPYFPTLKKCINVISQLGRANPHMCQNLHILTSPAMECSGCSYNWNLSTPLANLSSFIVPSRFYSLIISLDENTVIALNYC